MKKLFLVFALALVVGLSTASASNWNYSFTSTNISGSGALTAGTYAVDTYHALTATGTINSGLYNGAVLSLIAGGPGVTTSPDGAFNYNNLFYYPPSSAGGYLDLSGLLFAFTTTTGTYELNVWGNGASTLANNFSVYAYTPSLGYTLTGSGVASFAVTPSAVPEPGFYGVLALGLSGLFVGVRRRRRT